MTKKEKLLLKILKRPKDMRFSDVRTLLIDNGYLNKRTKGSHFIFSNNKNIISVPVHNNLVKKIYLEKIIELLKLED